MDWIKKNPEKFVLLLFSVALLATAGFIFYTEQNFLASFEPLRVPPSENNTLPPLETKSLDSAQQSLEKPQTWTFNKETEGYLFVSRPYVVQENGTVSGTLTEPSGGMWYPPVKNDWLLKYGLDLMDSNVINEDPDGDGFSNKEEFLAGTDPSDKNSHPPYTAKLYLAQFVPKPFRLIFNGRPDNSSFQIDTVDIQQPTQILSMGDTIANTTYKIVGFVEKHTKDESDIDHDVSELTVQNTDTGKKVILVMGVVTNDPDTYGVLRYFWKGSHDFKVKPEGTFTLDPEKDVTYKVIDIEKDHATIVDVKTNKEITIPLLKQGDTFHYP